MRSRARYSAGRTGLFLLAIAAIRPHGAAAQDNGRWEVGLFGGASFGARISPTPSADVGISDAPAFGLRGGYDLGRHLALEGTFSRANARLVNDSPATRVLLGQSARIDVNTYEFNGLHRFGARRARGYFGLGAGVMDLHPHGPWASTVFHETGTRFVANVALGGMLFVDEHFAFRIDGRYRWRATEHRLGAVICDSTGCSPFSTSLYSSAEVTLGTTYRFAGETVRTLPPPSDAAGSSIPVGPESARRFWTAAGELTFFELGPWAYIRYVTNLAYVRISLDSVGQNFRTGFTFDRDNFWVNLSRHPYQGSLFFNAARSNGYDFWESAAFSLVGGFAWECCMEREPPAINDLVSTTLGGMTRGEIGHRLSRILLNDTVRGWSRLCREVVAVALDPAGGLSRLLYGKTAGDFLTPGERFPGTFRFDVELGYRHKNGDSSNPSQGILTLDVGYGDPFAGDMHRPFDSFTIGMDLAAPGDGTLIAISLGTDLTAPGGTIISRIEQQGILKGWELGDQSADVRHILGVFMGYTYLNDEAQRFGAQTFSFGLLSRRRLGHDLKADTELSGVVLPLAAIQTSTLLDPTTGRSYEFAPGGGFRAIGRLSRGRYELASVDYGIAWAHTADGTSRSNRLQFFRATARVALSGKVDAGVHYKWYRRDTIYSPDRRLNRTFDEWSVFLGWSLFEKLRG